MNKKFIDLLTEKCKDFGLTSKAIEDLAKLGSEGLDDNSSDEDITKKVDLLVPFAKSMQAEITRKAQQKPSKKEQSADGDGEGNGEGNHGNENEPAWFKTYRESQEKRLKSLEDENAALKNEKSQQTRTAFVNAKGKELNIPDFLLKRLRFADDAKDEDIEKELKEMAQDLVTNKLAPKAQQTSESDRKAQMEEAAEAWAKSLPDAK